jgi:peptidoglycan/LPS O-acetylase OafA/YrhL
MSDRAPLDREEYLAQSYFPVLDGLRALCVLLVVTVHLYDLPWLWKWFAGARGVTVFFVLSGYLITTLALREEQRRGRLALTAFYLRRSCRIFPLYYLTLGVYALLILGLGQAPAQRPLLTRALPYYLLYLQEVPFFSWLVQEGQDLPFFHSWSLGIEEKFYLVWPLLAFVILRGVTRRRLAAALALTAATVLLPPLLTSIDPHWKIAARGVFCYYPILVGCLTALLLHDPRWFARLRWLGCRTGLWLLLFLAAHLATPWTPTAAAYSLDVVYSVCTALLLAALLLGEGPIQRFLRGRALVGVGRLSYGVYLVHVLCVIAVHRFLPVATGRLDVGLLAYAATCGLSIAVAWILFCVVEKPCIEAGRRWTRWLSERAPVQSEAAFRKPGCGRQPRPSLPVVASTVDDISRSESLFSPASSSL